MQYPTRRDFFKGALAVAATTALTPGTLVASAQSRPRHPVRLGGPVFDAPANPEALARAHRKLGYAAAYCPNLPLEDTARLGAVREAFARQGVVLAEVGRWVNLLDTDPRRRAENLRFVTEGLALAEEVGALCCVDIAGSFNDQVWYGPHPDNLSQRFFDAAVENARKIIDAVKPRRAKFAYEMMGWALPDSPDACLKLLRAVNRKAFAVHLDPCNLINSPTRFYRNTDLINECFDKLGRWIVSCHAKDLAWEVEMNIHFREVIPGLGKLDYATYLRRLAALPHQPPLMLEHLANADEYARGAAHIRQAGQGIGVTFA